MKARMHLLLPTLLLVGCVSAESRSDPLCRELVRFAASATDEQPHSVTLTTDWGGRFAKQEGKQLVMAQKDCAHGAYEPGKVLCGYLLENSSTEFAVTNLNGVLVCLSGGSYPPPRDADTEYLNAKFSFYAAPAMPASTRTDVEFTTGAEDRPPALTITSQKLPE